MGYGQDKDRIEAAHGWHNCEHSDLSDVRAMYICERVHVC